MCKEIQPLKSTYLNPNINTEFLDGPKNCTSKNELICNEKHPHGSKIDKTWDNEVNS